MPSEKMKQDPLFCEKRCWGSPLKRRMDILKFQGSLNKNVKFEARNSNFETNPKVEN
jgi:hypothetical protein